MQSQRLLPRQQNLLPGNLMSFISCSGISSNLEHNICTYKIFVRIKYFLLQVWVFDGHLEGLTPVHKARCGTVYLQHVTNKYIIYLTLNLIVFFYQLDAQFLYFNTFITFLYTFRALLCSSSGGQLC